MAVKMIPQGGADHKPPVTVKGVKDGLLFIIDEQCAFDAVLEHLRMLFQEGAALFSGPSVSVSVDYGSRTLSREDAAALLALFLERENFVIREWAPKTQARRSLFSNPDRGAGQSLYRGTVRAGQSLFFEGDVVIIGDVNPGGEVAATGDVYVFGRLRGIAHAGSQGDSRSIIAAVEFAPVQLRIAGVISRTPEVDGHSMNTFMEFAYLTDEGMAVDKIQYAATIRAAFSG